MCEGEDDCGDGSDESSPECHGKQAWSEVMVLAFLYIAV
jgi:hypothetical protein